MIPDTIEEICELFDCVVIEDYEDFDDTYSIGSHGDWTCHEKGYKLTPVFKSYDELEAFCETDEGKEYINEAAGRVFFDWDVDLEDWRE